MQEESVFKKSQDVVTRTIGNETILLPLYKTSDEIDCIYTLNDVGAIIWDLIDGKKTVTDIKKAVLNRFDVTREELDKGLTRFLKELLKIKAII